MKHRVNREVIQAEALTKAQSGQSLMNYTAIFEGFMAKGIPESQIKPRENVFTFNAWRALGRSVKRGEHGVRCVTFIDTVKKDKATGEETHGRRPWTTTVFHVSQTEPTPTGAQIREYFQNDDELDATINTRGDSYAGELEEAQ